MTDAPSILKTITIAVVDDHQVLTDALVLALGAEADFQIVGVAGTCAAARGLLTEICPDVLLLDISLPDGDGLQLVPEFKRSCPKTSILVLTSHFDEKTLLRVIETGVGGFVSKSRPLSEVITAVRQAAEGEIVMPASLLLALATRTSRSRAEYLAQNGHEPLTPREREILIRLAQGKTGSEIADEFHIAPLTVRTHIRNLIDKLGVHSRLEAVTHALRQGLINPPI